MTQFLLEECSSEDILLQTDDKHTLHTLTTMIAITPTTIRKRNAMIHLSVATCKIMYLIFSWCLCVLTIVYVLDSENEGIPGDQSLSLVC